MANEALRAARMFVAMLNVDEAVRPPYEPPGPLLVRQYQSPVERVAQLTGVANV